MDFDTLRTILEGELLTDISTKIRYATDASVYREIPLGVAYPKNEEDIRKLILFASKNKISLIPRAAGTSLGGQVVGNGLIVDISKYFTSVIDINTTEQFAVVQPGVVRDELNLQIAGSGLFFAPETATSNRCRIGGMCGNNSCGANSLIYGSTRDHIISMKAILSDGSKVEFKALGKEEIAAKCRQNDLEGEIYRTLFRKLSDKEVQAEIKSQFPGKEIRRRCMGYAVDELLEMEPFNEKGAPFNLCSLLVGAEGTLVFITEIKVSLTPLTSSYKALLSIQTSSMEEALEANIVALQHKPASIELIDTIILELSKQNITQNKNRFFIQGDPEALLVVEVIEKSEEEAKHKLETIEQSLRQASLGNYFTTIRGNDMEKVWALRKAGLGIMSNMKGDAKPVTVVEDIAIHPNNYPAYYSEFKQLLKKYDLTCVFYAHISTGELHKKPVFNLKDRDEVEKFRKFAHETAVLVKKYGGSLSGEHGDGRLRGEFLSLMVGERNYTLFKEVKHLFDPDGVFNAGKIVDTPAMNTFLRYRPGKATREIKTRFDFSDTDGILRAIEKCNGSGDCLKSRLFNGNMCPSYMAGKDEMYSARARANILREFLTHSPKKNPFDHNEIYDILDVCIACKACKSECPSNVDMTKLKAEFLYHYHKQNGIPLRTRMIAFYPQINRLSIPFSTIYNFFCTQRFFSRLIKSILHFSPERSLPVIHAFTLRKWSKKHLKTIQNPKKNVYFFIDEFTNYNDVTIGITAIELLQKLHYQVNILDNSISGRTFFSKGLLDDAKEIAEKNISLFAGIIDENTPLIGLEPSAILSFRDEYPEIIDDTLKEKARKVAANTFLLDEFLADEFEKGNIDRNLFSKEKKEILFHSHCYQKALSNSQKSIIMMQIPENYKVEEIKSGCCGMAGAFGTEKEHYAISMQIGELSLFPGIRNKKPGTAITATGTSCRHQIKDGTGEKAMHPVEILYQAMEEVGNPAYVSESRQ